MQLRQIPINPAAVNAEAVIEILRTSLQALSYLDYILPRALPKRRKDVNGRVVKFPAIEQYKSTAGTYDSMSVEPLERTNFCFFTYDREIDNSEGFLDIINLSAIFYFDLRKIQSSQDIRTKLKQDIQARFNQQFPFELREMEIVDNDFESVWQGFQLPDLEMQYYNFPYYTVRFTFPLIKSSYICSPLNTYVKNNC